MIMYAQAVRSDVCLAGTCTEVVTVPLTCPPYSTTEQGAAQLNQCACAPGAYANQSGVPCTQCPLGTFSNTISTVKCTDCPHGTYMDAVGATLCWDCACGVVQNVVGAQDDSFCTPPRWVVRMVVSRMILTVQEAKTTNALIAAALGIPPSQFNRVSILSARRRNLLSVGTTTFQITVCTQAQANLFASQLTYPFLINVVFSNSQITPPASLISAVGVDLYPPPTIPPSTSSQGANMPPSTTPSPAGGPDSSDSGTTSIAPSTTPSPAAAQDSSLLVIVGASVGGFVVVASAVTLTLLGMNGKLNFAASKRKDTDAKTDSLVQMEPMPMLKVRINRKIS